MGRPRKFNRKTLAEAWAAYKADCDNRVVLTHDFSSKNSEFVSAGLRRSVTYTIEGFCVFIGIALTEAQTRQTEVNTLLNVASQTPTEQIRKDLCALLDWDYEALKDNFPDDPAEEAQRALTALEGAPDE